MCFLCRHTGKMRQETGAQSIVAHPGKQEAVPTTEPTLFQPVFPEELDGRRCLFPPPSSPQSLCLSMHPQPPFALLFYSISGIRPLVSLSFPPFRVSCSSSQLCPRVSLPLPTTFPSSPRYLRVRRRCLCVFMLCLAPVHVALQWRVLKGWDRSQLARTQSCSGRMAKQGHAAEVNAVRIVRSCTIVPLAVYMLST